MAGQLGREFHAQSELGRIIQAILGETNPARIVRVLLENIGLVIPCDCAGVSLLEPGAGTRAAATTIHPVSLPNPPETVTATMELTPEEVDRLASLETILVTRPGECMGRYLSRWPVRTPAVFLLAPMISRGELLGVLLLSYMDPQDPTPEIPPRLRQIADQTAIALSRAALIRELNENDQGTLQALSLAVDANSHWTAGHSRRVTALAMKIGAELGLPAREIDVLQRGGLLHDIGKLGIPPSILDKPGSLTEEEFAVIRRHPSDGMEILRPIPSLAKVLPIVSQHHERFDGSGYPLGLQGNAISQHARITAVADVFDALTSERPYRGGWPRDEVLAYLSGNAGVQFDPESVAAFLRIAARTPDLSLAADLWTPAQEFPADLPSPDAVPAPARGDAPRGGLFRV